MAGLEPGPPGDEGNSPVSMVIEVVDDLLDSREVINSQIAHVSPNRREVEESYGNPSSGKFVNQSQADFGGHDGNAANVVLQHSLGGLSGSARVIVGVAENGVVTKLAGADFETLDHFREKRIFDVRYDDSQRPAVARGQVPCMNVREVPETLDRREHQQVFAPAHFARLV